MSRITIARLKTLEDRRLSSDLILAFFITTGRFDLPLENVFTRPYLNNLRGQRLKLNHMRFRLNRRGAVFSVKIANY